MMGAVVKRYFAAKLGKKAKDICLVGQGGAGEAAGWSSVGRLPVYAVAPCNAGGAPAILPPTALAHPVTPPPPRCLWRPVPPRSTRQSVARWSGRGRAQTSVGVGAQLGEREGALLLLVSHGLCLGAVVLSTTPGSASLPSACALLQTM